MRNYRTYYRREGFSVYKSCNEIGKNIIRWPVNILKIRGKKKDRRNKPETRTFFKFNDDYFGCFAFGSLF